MGIPAWLVLLLIGTMAYAGGRHPVGVAAASAPELSLPRTILWAWERREDLRAIDPRQVGVAYLATTLFLRHDTVVMRPRLQPLYVPPDTVLIPVVRLETDRFAPPTLSAAQRARVVTAIAELGRTTTPPAIQIDFDARRSERDFYRAVLQHLRQALPHNVAISITALASWCLGDNWLTDLPIDEAVAMLFRLGADRQRIQRHLRSGGAIRCAAPQSSLGIATDEPLPLFPAAKRVYIFHPQAWSSTAVHTALEEVKPWQ